MIVEPNAPIAHRRAQDWHDGQVVKAHIIRADMDEIGLRARPAWMPGTRRLRPQRWQDACQL
jgi:hypothetical protein